MITKKHIILRDIRESGDMRHLEARLNDSNDLVIAGQDIGDTVQELLGGREYEWAWTIRAQDLPRLLTVLSAADGDVLAALGRRFSGNDAANLGSFLEENEIPHERWSRVGD